MRYGSVFRDACDTAANLDIAVWILRVDDRERDRCTFLQIARLDPPLGGVDAHMSVLEVEPDRRHLGRAVRHRGGDDGKRLLLSQQVEIFFWSSRHGLCSLLCGSLSKGGSD